MKLFSAKRDFLILLAAIILIQMMAPLLMNHAMFQPFEDGYDHTLSRYLNISTNQEQIAAMFLGPAKEKKVILYCHGNAEDLTAGYRFSKGITDHFSVASVDYPGYGLSSGKPTEAGCYQNAHRLYDWLVQTKGFAPKDIIVLGYSIGSGIATELASTKPVGGLILEAPFLSAPQAVTRVRLLLVNPFPNAKRIRNVKCPLLVIHGDADRIVPFSQGKKLFQIANEPKRFVPVPDANHTDYIKRMGQTNYENLILQFIRNLK